MKKKKEEQAENPLHREYGIPSNIRYCFQNIRKYKPILIIFIVIGMAANSFMQVLGSFARKYVIDLVMLQAESTDKDIMPLVKLLLVLAVFYIVVWGLDDFSNNRRDYYFIYVRMKMITERVAKAISMNYQNLENPKILDMHEKACRATGGNDEGVEGMMRAFYTVLVKAALLVISLSVVMMLDLRLVLLIIVVSLVQYFFFRHTVKRDRAEVWDKLAPVWRRMNYMEQMTQDFSYAKDIRLFHMQDWLLGKQHKVFMEKQQKMLHSRNLWIYNSIFAHGTSMLQTLAIYMVLILAFMGKGMTIGNFTLYLGSIRRFGGAVSNVFSDIV
ncbi:MAG: hypothetical protein K2I01_04175, partial [Lachnospiraceae bacterium]|nr:hypothetical protein [Lachnospiraceae bacterium]